MDDKKVSMAVVKRLPRYYRYLTDLLKLEVNRISSKELSEKMGITASQIRQDLNCFGGFGQQGYGYNVEILQREIGKILGMQNKFKAIIIGAGNMGNAIANYSLFAERGYSIVAIFDNNTEKVGKIINNLAVLDMNELENYIKNNRVDIAILTVPFQYTSQIAERVASLGIKGIWNFSPMDLRLSHEVKIENVHLSDSLMVLGYRMNKKIEEDKASL